MSEKSADLDTLLESVADGNSIDWDKLETAVPDDGLRRLVRELRLIAEVGEVHRSHIDRVVLAEDAAAAGSATAPAGGWPPADVPQEADARSPGGRDRWGHLLLVRKIGEGSYGEVYQAHDTWLDHPVALKLLKPEAEKRVSPSEILQEARKLARIRHHNVVIVHGADRHDGRVGFWMDFIEGETLATAVARGRFSEGEAAHIGREVCRALAAVHQAKIIHRDVKAQNVMRAADGGRIILMDFGAGQFIEDRSLPKRAQGTPLYLAPELFSGGDASVRSDIYAVGALLYHLVTGGFPVEASSYAGLAEAHERRQRKRLRDERPDLSENFIAVVERALDPDPERRYASAGEMEARLSSHRTGAVVVPAGRSLPVPAPAPSAVATYLKGAVSAIAAFVVLAGVLGLIGARAFDSAMGIDPEFSLGPTLTFRLGRQALFPFLVYWAVCAAVTAALYALWLVVPRPLRRRLEASVDSLNPTTTATAIAVFGVASLMAIMWRYKEIFDVMSALAENPLLPRPALFLLTPASQSIHTERGLYSVAVSFVLGLAAWRWFPHLERRSEDGAIVRLMKRSTLLVAFLVVAQEVVPRRFVWDDFTVAKYDNHAALVIGTTEEELLLYAPDEPDRPRFRVRRDASGLELTGDTRPLFASSR
jgi:serine/threonine-protein kinase